MRQKIKEAYTFDINFGKKQSWYQLSSRQMEAYRRLTDSTTSTIVYWWAGWGWKTQLWCFWIISQCFANPWSRWLVCRALKTTLRDSTINNFWNCLRDLEITDSSYHWDNTKMVLTFKNWSTVLFRWLEYAPSDPMYENILQWLELTWAWFDEATEMPEIAYTTTRFTRIRHKCDYLGCPKVLLTCNPNRTSYIYTMFYKPFVLWTLDQIKEKACFIKALPTDNPRLDSSYIQSLLNNPNPVSVQRMYYWNWEYDDNPWLLFDYTLIERLFYWDVYNNPETYYLSIDPARKGRDKTVIWLWKWLELVDVREWVQPPEEYKEFPFRYTNIVIKDLKRKYDIPNYCIVIDSDGCGGWIADEYPWCVNMINNASPIQPKVTRDRRNKHEALNRVNYANLKTQVYYKLQEFALTDKVKIKTPERYKQIIQEELGIIAQKDIDKDWKIALISKSDMKAIIWRSPDFSDMIAYRMIFEIQPRRSVSII